METSRRLFRKVKPEVLMAMLPVKPERKAQLDAYAERNGQGAVTALDDVLADYFDGHSRTTTKPCRRC